MGSPDGNGSSTGEGRKGALLLLRGRPPEAGTSERASTLPSSNALRPDSGLNLGWYRPAAPEDRPAESASETSRPTTTQPGRVGRAAVDGPSHYDTSGPSREPASCDLERFCRSVRGGRGARRRQLAAGSKARNRTGRASGSPMLRRLAAVRLGTGAREVRKRPPAVGVAAVLLVRSRRGGERARAARPARSGTRRTSDRRSSASQLPREFLSEVRQQPCCPEPERISTRPSVPRRSPAPEAVRIGRLNRTSARQSEQPPEGRAELQRARATRRQ